MGLRIGGMNETRLALHGHFVGHCARCQKDDGRIGLAHGLCKFIVFENVVFQVSVAELPRSIGLVANIPIPDTVRRGMAVPSAPCAHGCIHRSIQVLNLVRRRVRIAKARVYGDVWFHSKEFAQGHEFVQAHIVDLHGVPSIIEHRRALVDVAHGVVPAPVGDEIAPGQAPHSSVHLAQKCDRIGTEAVDIVCRHQRYRADMKVPTANTDDFKGAVVGARSRAESKRKPLVSVRERSEGDRLPVVRARAPDQTDLYPGARSAAQIDPSYILFALDQSNSALPNAMGRGDVECNARALIAHKGMVLVHRHNLIGPHRPPLAERHGERGSAPPARRRWGNLGIYRRIELAVVKHLGPQAPRDKRAALLDESAVKVLRNRRCGLSSVNGYDDPSRKVRPTLLRDGCNRASQPQCRSAEQCCSCLHQGPQISSYLILPLGPDPHPGPRIDYDVTAIGRRLSLGRHRKAIDVDADGSDRDSLGSIAQLGLLDGHLRRLADRVDGIQTASG